MKIGNLCKSSQLQVITKSTKTQLRLDYKVTDLLAYVTRKFKGNQAWFSLRTQKMLVSLCLWASVTQDYCSPYWSCSEADSSLEVRFTEPNFQYTSLSSLGKMGKISIGSFPINPEKHVDSHWTSWCWTPHPESITEAKGIDCVNGQRWGSYDYHGWEEWGKEVRSADVIHMDWKQGRRAMFSVTGKRDGQAKAIDIYCITCWLPCFEPKSVP